MSGLCIVGGVGASKGEGKGHVVKSPLSSSFICSLVFITTTCEGRRYPMYQIATDVPKLQFVLHTSGALDRLPLFKQGEIVTFSLVDILRKDIKYTEYIRWSV